jgi:hypothetical protein
MGGLLFVLVTLIVLADARLADRTAQGGAPSNVTRTGSFAGYSIRSWMLKNWPRHKVVLPWGGRTDG